MSVNKRIIDALDGLGLPVKPDVYDGPENAYLVFNYSTMGTLFADNRPSFERYLVQVHYFCPGGVNSLGVRRAVKQKLFAAGFTWPEEVDAGDEGMKKGGDAKQHFVFECEAVEGAEPDG